MTIFMYLLLPLILTLFCFCYRSRKNVPIIFMGAMAAIILCAVKMLFFYSHRIVPFSFMENFSFFLIRESFLPAIIIYGLLLIFSKDTLDFKTYSVFPLLTSFYAIYMPYSIYNSPSGYFNSFSLFIKPISYAIMLISIGILSKEIGKNIKAKKFLFVALYVLAAIVCLIIPSILESYYLITTKLLVVIIITICFGAFPITYSVLKVLGKIKE